MRISLVVFRTVIVIVGICSFTYHNNVESKFSIGRVVGSSRGHSRSRGLGNNRWRSSNGISSSISSGLFSHSALGTDFLIGDGEPWYSSSSSFSGRGSGSYKRGNQVSSSSLIKQSDIKQYQSSSSKKKFDVKNREKASSEGKVGKLINMKVGFPTLEDKLRWRYDKVRTSNGYWYSFDDWNRNTHVDGWVCRNDVDCVWIDSNLGCDDREFDLNKIQVEWFGKAALRGRCACKNGYWFDSTTRTCYKACLNSKSDAYCDQIMSDGNCNVPRFLERCRKTCGACEQGAKYQILIKNKRETCENSGGNQISGQHGYTQIQCQRVCTIDDECSFFYHTSKNWCSLYKSCSQRRTTRISATTFQKFSLNEK